MGEYRHRTTGEVKTQGEWRAAHRNTSFPKVWTKDTLDSIQLDAILEAPMPTAGQYQTVVRNGVTKDSKGNWVTAWLVQDMFADDADGTKAEKEAAYQATLDAVAAKSVREQRNRLLTETDWTQISDAPVDQVVWKTYRQALRDITTQSGFPHNITWPVKPE